MDQLFTLAMDYWGITLVAVLLLMAMTMMVKAVARMLGIAVLIGLVLMLGFGYSQTDVANLGQKLFDHVSQTYETTVKPVLEAEIAGADVSIDPDGSYLIRTKSVQISGKKGEPTVTVTYKDSTFTLRADELGELVRQYIPQRDTPVSL